MPRVGTAVTKNKGEIWPLNYERYYIEFIVNKQRYPALPGIFSIIPSRNKSNCSIEQS